MELQLSNYLKCKCGNWVNITEHIWTVPDGMEAIVRCCCGQSYKLSYKLKREKRLTKA